MTKRFLAKHPVAPVWWIAGIVAAACASGCSTAPTQAADTNDGIDHAKVQAVERAATHYGVKVYWINMPRQRKGAL